MVAFAPHGLKGVINSLLIVIYSYGGSELIAITVSETEDPKTAIPRAIRGVIGRIILFISSQCSSCSLFTIGTTWQHQQ